MGKYSKRGIVLLAVLIITACTVFAVKTEAKNKPALNCTKKTLYITKSKYTYSGQYYYLQVSDAPSRPKWSTSKKNVATVSKNGTVIARNPGTATITAKMGSTSLKCKITVKKKPSQSALKKKVQIKTEIKDGYGFITIKNNIEADANITYKLKEYDSNGKLLATGSWSSILPPKGTAGKIVRLKEDADYIDVEKLVPALMQEVDIKNNKTPSTYQITSPVSSGKVVIKVKEAAVKPDFAGDKLIVTYEVDNKTFGEIWGSADAVFYNNGKITGAFPIFLNKLGGGVHSLTWEEYGFNIDFDITDFQYDEVKIMNNGMFNIFNTSD